MGIITQRHLCQIPNLSKYGEYLLEESNFGRKIFRHNSSQPLNMLDSALVPETPATLCIRTKFRCKLRLRPGDCGFSNFKKCTLGSHSFETNLKRMLFLNLINCT